jgi:hypothetical protein
MKQDKEDSVKDEQEQATPEEIKAIAETSLILYIRKLKDCNSNALDKIVQLKHENADLKTQLAAKSEQIRQLQTDLDIEKESAWSHRIMREACETALAEARKNLNEWREAFIEKSKRCEELESLLLAAKEKHGQIAKEAFDIAEYYKIIEMDEYLTDKSTYLSSLTQTDVKTEK